jgi:predicted nucleotidyltransferase
MNREQVIATLRSHEPERKQSGVVRLSLFGSTVRGDRRPHSDIDLLAAFDETRRISLLDVIHIENQIADLLGERIDFLVEGPLKPLVNENVAREAVLAF